MSSQPATVEHLNIEALSALPDDALLAPLDEARAQAYALSVFRSHHAWGRSPNTWAECVALAEAAGIAVENGIACDAMGRTSAPHVWAAGDCASFPWQGGRLRLESVGNAIDQAEAVAANIMGANTPYTAQPWFWSDQYDCKLQIAGLNTGYDRIVTRGGDGGAASVWYYRGDDLLAVDAMNDSRAYMVGKRLIEAGKSPAPAVVADPATELKALLKA